MKKRISLTLLFAVIPVLCLSSLEETIVLGKDDGWEGVVLKNCYLKEGREGFLDIMLEDSEYSPTPETDLLLHFNSPVELTGDGRYRTVHNDIGVTSKISRLGPGSGVFQHEKEGLVLEGDSTSLFYPGVSWKDFSIEFWIYPATMEEGETVLFWQGSRILNEDIQHQEVRVQLHDQRLSWRFDNFFLPPDMSPFSVEVRGLSLLIPRNWTHHLLRFDSSTGLLEYLVNGEPEGIVYVTASGSEDGTVYLPELGDTPESYLTVGNYFTGFLDELRITSSFVDDPSMNKLGRQRGVFISQPVDLGYTNTKVTSIKITDETPLDSDIFIITGLPTISSISGWIRRNGSRSTPPESCRKTSKGSIYKYSENCFQTALTSIRPWCLRWRYGMSPTFLRCLRPVCRA